jgi:hypothetical protein
VAYDDRPSKELYRQAATAALTAALPLIRAGVVEECAKVADARGWTLELRLAARPSRVERQLSHRHLADEIAAAIRKLGAGDA